jgi:glycosyltransferase involved in cell wall biosynthesis
MTPPRISTVTVAFNAAATIARTIDSVLAQTVAGHEYLVIDGGSTDGTLDILRHHAGRIRIVSEPDRGIYDAMNKGVRLARGTWIHLLNADDAYARPDALARVIDRLDPARTNYCDIRVVDEAGSARVQSFRYSRLRMLYGAYVPHPGLIVARSQYDAVGDYDLRWRIAADHDMILRLLERFPPNHIPELLSVMHQGGASTRALSLSASEFRDVAIAHGQPRWLAQFLYRVKCRRWGIAP